VGSDGKEKLDPSMRMFCEQIVDATMIRKPETMSPESQKAMYDAIVDFVRVEYVEGSCEGGQPCEYGSRRCSGPGNEEARD
jgi:exportin-T